MSQVYCIRRRRKGKHLEYVDRQELEHLVTQNIKASKKNKKTQQELAVLLGVSPSTMSRELKRGLIVLRDSEWREYESYSADVAQDDYDKKATHKGPGLKIGNDHALAKHIEDKILRKIFSRRCNHGD
jgi:IS30 family transposase